MNSAGSAASPLGVHVRRVRGLRQGVAARVAPTAARRRADRWDQLPDPCPLRPENCLKQRARLDALSRAIAELTDRQREVFVAVALNDFPIDVLAVKLGTNRNAVYKNLFDARRRLRARMAAAGHPVSERGAPRHRRLAAMGGLALPRQALSG